MSIFQQAVPLAEQAGDVAVLGVALSGLGWAQWATGQYEEALSTRRRALDIVQRREDFKRQAILLRGLGETYYSLGRYEQALEHYRLGLDANRRSPDPAEEASILANMGSTYRSQGRFDEAADVLGRALHVARASGDKPAVGQVLTFLGIVNRALGEFDRALGFYSEALAVRRETGDRRGESQVLGNMANVYLDLGQHDRSAELTRASLALAEKIGYIAQVGFAQQNLGAALSRIPRPLEALKYYEAALVTFRKIDRRAQITNTLRSIGTLQAFLLDDRVNGRTRLGESLDAARANRDREGEGYALYEIGSLDAVTGDLKAAIERLDTAVKIGMDLGEPNLQYLALANRGVVLRRLGRMDAAIADLRASAAIVNDLRANVGSDLLKISYTDTRQSVFHDLALTLGDAGRPEEALEAAEAARARAFADLLNARQIRGRHADERSLQELRTALSATAASGVPAVASSGSSSERGAADRVGAAIERVRGENRELASLLTVESPRFAEIKATAGRLRATLVAYLVTEDALLAWVVSPAGDLEHLRTNVSAGQLDRMVASLRRGLESPTIDGLRHTDALDVELRGLHEVLITPLSRWLPGSRDSTVVFVPHGATALVPFAALENARGVPLVERYTIAIAPSISVFRYTQAKRRPSAEGAADALIIADPVPPADSQLEPLPGTREEGRLVAKRLRNRAKVLEGGAATEAAVKTSLAGSRIIHFATHGLVSPVRPIASSLVLGEGGGEDGYLRVDEIFGLDLAADLVVLSGCSTGLGRFSGDGIFGLTRAFIYAGTPSVVVSNWDVSDRATALLMDRFYAGLVNGVPKARALAEAQRAARLRYPHPALWAAFAVMGEPQ